MKLCRRFSYKKLGFSTDFKGWLAVTCPQPACHLGALPHYTKLSKSTAMTYTRQVQCDGKPSEEWPTRLTLMEAGAGGLQYPIATIYLHLYWLESQGPHTISQKDNRNVCKQCHGQTWKQIFLWLNELVSVGKMDAYKSAHTWNTYHKICKYMCKIEIRICWYVVILLQVIKCHAVWHWVFSAPNLQWCFCLTLHVCHSTSTNSLVYAYLPHLLLPFPLGLVPLEPAMTVSQKECIHKGC